MPIGTYGGELFGMSEVRTRPIQIIAVKSLRLIDNVSKATAINRLRTEFGIPSINSICSRARKRAYFKWPISKTWVADLIRQLLKIRLSTWLSDATRATIEARNVRYIISNWLIKHQMQNSSNWINLQLLYPELRIGLHIIGKIRSETYWTTERLAKLQLISKIYREKCPCCNVNVPENLEHILIDCYRWAAIRSETIGQFIPRLFRICNDNKNEPLTQAKMKLVGKLLGGESKKFLLQLQKKKMSNVPLSMELETAKLMYGICVARTLILDGIKFSPTPFNQFPVDMETKIDCVAQAINLFETIKRRKLEKLKTYIGFIDFEKAYDRVPHDQLFHKLECSGIGEKLLQVIKAGVSVPVLDDKISGLLFADDAVILAESADELQK
ncbi:hypothetical protein BB561_005754 [Smittium simulii]|uniref:Reverse transcriptase domain-containing protein n=1 Tax=Smittium simulii TaxID=133385 RepID=A0A2T9Y8H2_9FUNG|nr:hypothetical protein BB561_005754 [Smittium simulii]